MSPPRGGARPGSGPKPLEPGGKDRTFRLYPSDINAIRHIAATHNTNQSQALRHIIRTWTEGHACAWCKP